MFTLQSFDVFDLEGFDVEVVEAEEGDGVVDVEAQCEGADEVFAFLERCGGWRGGVGGCAEFDGFGADVHADLEVEVGY